MLNIQSKIDIHSNIQQRRNKGSFLRFHSQRCKNARKVRGLFVTSIQVTKHLREMRKSTILLDRRKRRLHSLFSSWKAAKQLKTDFILLRRKYGAKRAQHLLRNPANMSENEDPGKAHTRLSH